MKYQALSILSRVDMSKVRAGKASELSPGKMMGLDVQGKKILLANVGGRFYAMDGLCSHMAGHLWEGKLVGTTVKCPRHGSEFDVTTGKNLKGPWLPFSKAFDQKTYPVSLDGEDLYLEI